MENSIITIGKDKNGEWDFGVRATVQSLSPKEMVELIYSMIDHLNEMKENVISGRKT